MPMPHRIQAQLIKKRLVGKEGQARVKELRAILVELPGYKNGPYADLRKWVEGQLVETRSRSRTLNRDPASRRSASPTPTCKNRRLRSARSSRTR